jgi:5-deoxy-glucuronate isomerase
MSDSRLHWPAGSLASGTWSVDLDQDRAGWSWSSLRVLDLSPGGSEALSTGPDELLVLPLAGSCAVSSGGQSFELAGRPSVFDGPTDFAYVPRGVTVEVSSALGGRFALPGARAAADLPFRYGAAAGVPVELRGALSCSRQVNNFCTETAFAAERLLACEVLTPAGNWSSYPPHKHDEDRPGESVLEEIYYFEFADTRRGNGGTGSPAAGSAGSAMGYHRVYGSSAARPVDVVAEVRSGDVVLVPHGWHGPSMAVPGYDLYYLNVMAGPGERVWRICDDPAHAWIRDTWIGQPVDPRLPFGRPEETERKRGGGIRGAVPSDEHRRSSG